MNESGQPELCSLFVDGGVLAGVLGLASQQFS